MDADFIAAALNAKSEASLEIKRLFLEEQSLVKRLAAQGKQTEARLEGECQNLRDEIESLRADLQFRDREIADLKFENEALRARNEGLSEEPKPAQRFPYRGRPAPQPAAQRPIQHALTEDKELENLIAKYQRRVGAF